MWHPEQFDFSFEFPVHSRRGPATLVSSGEVSVAGRIRMGACSWRYGNACRRISQYSYCLGSDGGGPLCDLGVETGPD